MSQQLTRGDLYVLMLALIEVRRGRKKPSKRLREMLARPDRTALCRESVRAIFGVKNVSADARAIAQGTFLRYPPKRAAA